MKLDYKQWMEFNLAQRAAKNYLEVITIFVFSLLILMFVWPTAAIIFAALNFVFRRLYAALYSRAPQARAKIAPLMFANTVACIVTSISACFVW